MSDEKRSIEKRNIEKRNVSDEKFPKKKALGFALTRAPPS